MKKKNLIFILTVLFLISQKYELNAQTSKKPVVTNKPVATNKPLVSNNTNIQISALKGVDINLFNKNDLLKLNKEPLYGPDESNFILPVGIVSDKLTKLLNNYYHLTGNYDGSVDQNYLLKNKNGDLHLISDQVRQMLNDTIAILDSGRLYNLMDDQFISSKLNKSILRITHNNYYKEENRLFIGVEGVGVKSQNFRPYPPILTDMLKLGEWDSPLGYIYKLGILYDRYLYNIANDEMKKFKRFRNDYYDEFVADNKYSKYILYRNTNSSNENQPKLMFINKYDAKDNLKVDSLYIVQSWELDPVYNDSIIIFQSKINKDIIKYPFNQMLDIDPKIYKVEEKWDYKVDDDKWALIKYINRKFNANEEPTKTDMQKFAQLKVMSDNTISYTPNVLVVYNYKNNKIVSILDKNTIPFDKIYDIFLDNTNQYLIVNSKGQRVTFFDLKSAKEVITFRGIANNVDEENNLILNLRSVQIKETPDKNTLNKNIQYIRINLNDFITNNNFHKDFGSKNYQLNEFTTKEEFAKIISDLDSLDITKFYSQQKLSEKNVLQNKADKITKPSNQILISNIESLYKDWYEQFAQIKQNTPEIFYEKNINFEYYNYENSSNVITLKSIETYNKDEIDSLDIDHSLQIDDREKNLTRFKETMQYPDLERVYTDLEYDKTTDKYRIELQLTGLGADYAKKIKSNQMKLNFKSIIQTKYNTPSYPPIERSFVFRKYNQLKGFFGDRYEEYPLSSEDTKASYEYYINPGFKKYVTHFFLIDGKSTRFYDELYK
jgi:hypothetical protein